MTRWRVSPVTDLDLDEIRNLLRQPHNFHLTLAANKLLAEVERLRDEVRILENSDALDVVTANAEIKRLKRLLGPPDMPTVDSYESMAAALEDERAAVVEHCDRIATLTALLAEVLGYFAGPYRDTVARSKFVPVETLDKWRSYLGRAS